MFAIARGRSFDKYGPSVDYTAQAVRLRHALVELATAQDATPFHLIDDTVPWSVRATRLLAWLQSHPDFECPVPIELRDDLPVEEGGRGVVARGVASAGDVIFRLPRDCAISTETAAIGVELGPLMHDPRLQLRDIPTVTLALHLMIEHAKAWAVPTDATDAAGALPVHPMLRRGALASARAEWERQMYGALTGGDEGDDSVAVDALSNGSQHGHSHGGVECGGHGHGHADDSAALGAASVTAAASSVASRRQPQQQHGHSHGGVECGGHGHGHADSPAAPILRTQLTPALHPWGTPWRPYISMLPAPDAMHSCLYFTDDELHALRGTPAGLSSTDFMRNAAKTYISLFMAFGPSAMRGAALIDGFEQCESLSPHACAYHGSL